MGDPLQAAGSSLPRADSTLGPLSASSSTGNVGELLPSPSLGIIGMATSTEHVVTTTLARSPSTSPAAAKALEERVALKDRCKELTSKIDSSAIKGKTTAELMKLKTDLIGEKNDIEKKLQEDVKKTGQKKLQGGQTVAGLEASIANRRMAALVVLLLLIFIVAVIIFSRGSPSWEVGGIGAGIVVTAGLAGRKIYQLDTDADIKKVKDAYDGVPEHLKELQEKWQYFEDTIVNKGMDDDLSFPH